MWGSNKIAMLVSSIITLGFNSMGVTGDSDIINKIDAIPDRQHIMVWHPHGLFVVAPLAFMTHGTRDRKSSTYGSFVAVADAVFKAPLFRLAVLMFNLRVADEKVLDTLLSNGRSVALCPGGIHEQLATDPKQERIFFPPNLGFIRQAMKHGLPLLPVQLRGKSALRRPVMVPQIISMVENKLVDWTSIWYRTIWAAICALQAKYIHQSWPSSRGGPSKP